MTPIFIQLAGHVVNVAQIDAIGTPVKGKCPVLFSGGRELPVSRDEATLLLEGMRQLHSEHRLIAQKATAPGMASNGKAVMR